MVTADVLNQGAGAAGASITKFDLVSTAPGGLRKNLKGVQNIPVGGRSGPGASAAPPVTVAVYSDTVPGHVFPAGLREPRRPKMLESQRRRTTA